MMKKEYKKIKLFGMFAFLLLVQAAAQATYVSSFLPQSNYGLDGWEGRRPYTQGGVDAVVEYAVYDREASSFPSLFGDVGTGQYIYAYQAFNINSNPTAQSIATFELLITGKPSATCGITSKIDPTDLTGKGIETIHEIDSFKWAFKNSVFVYDKHSWLMVFSSDSGPTIGDFKLTTQDSGDDTPVPGTPEPATMALLAAGAVGILKRRKTQKS